MDRITVAVLCLLAVFGSHCEQAPATTRGFDVGTTYTYDYRTTVLLNEPGAVGRSDVGFEVSAKVEITNVWENPHDHLQKLLQLKLTDSQLYIKSRKAPTPEGFVEHKSKLSKLPDNPLLLEWNNGHIGAVYTAASDPLAAVNLKKGVASLFQYKLVDSVSEEVDASGRCDVTYKHIDSIHIYKTKRNCRLVHPATSFTHTNKLLQPELTSSSDTRYELAVDEAVIHSAESTEVHTMRVKMRSDSGTTVVSKQILQMTGSVATSSNLQGSTPEEAARSLSKSLRIEFISDQLAAGQEARYCLENCRKLTQLVTDYKDNLMSKNLASLKSAIAFMKLLQNMRESSKEEILSVLKNPGHSKILPQLLDVAAASQTSAAHQGALDVLNFNSNFNIDLPERYLLSVSLSTHPNEYIITSLLQLLNKKIPNEKLYQSVILTVAAVTNTFCKIPGNGDKQVVKEVTAFILEKLKNCNNVPCREAILRALKNLNNPSTIPLLVKFMLKGDKKLSVIAAKALEAMPVELIDKDTKNALEKVYLQIGKKFDSTVRTIAVDLLLRTNPSEEVVREILSSLSWQDYPEVNTFILRRLLNLKDVDGKLKQIVESVLSNTDLRNYNVLAQEGLSTAFSRYFSVDAVNGNSSFTSMMEIGCGLLKRSVFDVFLEKQEDELQLLSFGLFAAGLSSFTGSEEEEDIDPDEVATAGMEFTLMGVQLRPFVFFSGQGELMGLVWSGAGSEKTTALQATALLQDHTQVLPLHNGLAIDVAMTGAVSFDFSGQIQISLWNRNAHSLVENSAALLVLSSMSVDTSYVRSQVESTFAAEPKLNAVTDTEFYDGVKMCMQMVQPNFQIKQNTRKIERIPGSKHKLRKVRRRLNVSPGKTFALNRKNSEICSLMFS